MIDVLNSIKADLSSRRMLPVLALVVAALVAAIAYAALSGGSSPSTNLAAAPAPSQSSIGTSVSATKAPANVNASVSETTSGAQDQSQGGAHDPFIPLARPATKATKNEKSTTAATSATTTSSGSAPSGSSGGTPVKATPTPTKPKPVPVYNVAVMFGTASTVPGEAPQLTSFENLKRLTPFPSTGTPLVVFSGVSSSGKAAIFAVTGETILKGQAVCLPSAAQCEAIDLAVGYTEELSYLAPTGQNIVYELKVESISKHDASVARATRLNARVSKAGRTVLRHLEIPVLGKLRFSLQKGVLLYARPHHHR